MEKLFEKFRIILKAVSPGFERSLMQKVKWDSRLICIRGARGVGKTTLILQYIKKNCPDDPSVLYVSLDDIWFSANSLSDLADNFYKQGGKRLFLDEVHKYKNWSQEIKNIYDSYPELKVVFTGSSLLNLKSGSGDLSRRADNYTMQGLSFREYLNFEVGAGIPVFSLEDITTRQLSVSDTVLQKVKPLALFRRYLRSGYYPFYKDKGDLYHDTINEVISYIIETELPQIKRVDPDHAGNIKKILLIIAGSAPFTPNISALSRASGINNSTILNYINYLSEAEILLNIYAEQTAISLMKKPDRLFVENTNIQYALPCYRPDNQDILETFLANQLSYGRHLTVREGIGLVTPEGLTFGAEQQSARGGDKNDPVLSGHFMAVDNTEYGHGNRIPAWMFGLLY